MNCYVGVTDYEWFSYLAERSPDEVNFWRPGGNQAFRALSIGEPFLFKLHSPQNYVVGGGFFVSFTQLPLSIAWQTFGKKNGTTTFSAFRKKLLDYRQRGKPAVEHDPIIGCIVLTSPFFFRREDWVPVPADWKPNLVQGRKYDTSKPPGMDLWKQVEARLQETFFVPTQVADIGTVAESKNRYGTEFLTKARLGQGAFRVLVTEAYNRRCAVTGERTLPVLAAAHIRPFAEAGPNLVKNGLLLRSDLHILFDRGYLTITDDLCVEVSPRIKEEYMNGREYYALHGKKLAVSPTRLIDRPSPEFLEWHQQNIYIP